MPLAKCNTTVDDCGRELVEHGTTAFPIACYHDDLSKDAVPWHWHEELEAAIITEGCAIVAAGNEKYTIHQGEGFFINSGILHGAWDIDASSCRFHSMVFHPRIVGGSIDSVFFHNYVGQLTGNRTLESILLTPSVSWQRDALNAIEDAYQACVKEPPGYEFKVRNALSELVFLLHSNIQATNQPPSNKTLRDCERIKSMLKYIHEHFGDELNTKDIAQSVAISESECLRCFRNTIQTTPIQYVRQYRIQRAVLLLTTTNEKVADIATKCGFQDISYFTKTFRVMKGCVPSEYRSKNGIESR